MIVKVGYELIEGEFGSPAQVAMRWLVFDNVSRVEHGNQMTWEAFKRNAQYDKLEDKRFKPDYIMRRFRDERPGARKRTDDDLCNLIELTMRDGPGVMLGTDCIVYLCNDQGDTVDKIFFEANA